MEKKEKQYTVTEIKKCDKKLKSNKINIILFTILAIESALSITLSITFTSNSVLVGFLAILVLLGSSIGIRYSTHERPRLKQEREELGNKIKFDKIPDPTENDIDFGLDEPPCIYYRK